MKRRAVLKAAAAGVALSALPRTSFARGPLPPHRRVDRAIVLGFDGMDPELIKRYAAAGHLPTFAKLIARGQLRKLGTTTPPHSPVAWSSFISGTNPGGHGIFDFIHRDPSTFTPFMSTSRAYDGSRRLDLGRFSIPLDSGRFELRRRGPTVWKELARADVPTTVFQIPGNFPVEDEEGARVISGMGTPDLLGSYGTFTLFSELPVPGAADFTGGRVQRIRLRDHQGSFPLEGPPHPLRADKKPLSVDFTIKRDPWEQRAQVSFGGTTHILKEGEWSPWMPIRFEVIPMFSSLAGMVRCYVKRVHPDLQIYVSPINVDPTEPVMPISTGDSFSQKLAANIGRFYTQGFPADTKGLSHKVLSNGEFFEQSKLVVEENMMALRYLLEDQREGLLYFYFSSVDQNSHMMWRLMDPTHPLYEPNESPAVKGAFLYFYKRMDDALALALQHAGEGTPVIALSDHGFAPFTRELHLSRWLVESGFCKLSRPGAGSFFSNVDWDATTAYALGINGLYVNLKGRDRYGSVPLERYHEVREAVREKLLQVRDPKTGAPVVDVVFRREEIYSGPWVESAPDLIVGYARGYRSSDEAVLGTFPDQTVGDRTDLWAADHCINPAVVPGMLVSNWDWQGEGDIWDLAPSILDLFGVTQPTEMTGRNLRFMGA